MKVIIAGSRFHVSEYDERLQEVVPVLDSKFQDIDEVVSGGARGYDRLGERWASAYDIPIRQFIPDWDGLGKKAGFVRNRDMGDYADALIAFWDGKSKGTKGMIDYMKSKGKPVKVVMVDE